MSTFAESVVEDAALAWLESLGYAIKHGPEIGPGELFAERADYGAAGRPLAAAVAKNATVQMWSGNLNREGAQQQRITR